MVYYFVGQKNIFQEKSEALLLNILPKEIARILKNEQRTIADHYAGASILFADMVNFTPMSAEMSPVEIVELLNQVFSHFDTLVEKHDLEKIQLATATWWLQVPRPRSDHAQVQPALR
jgi:guanylate cyclase